MVHEARAAILIVLVSLLPFIAALITWKSGERIKWIASFTVPAISFITLLIVTITVPASSRYAIAFPSEMPPIGLSFAVERVGLYFALIACLVWTLVSIYAGSYLSGDRRAGRFHTASLLSFAGTLGVGLAGDMFTLFLFFELMSLAAYVLIIHDETQEALGAGFKYLLMTIGGSLGLFLGLILNYQAAGTLSFQEGPFGASAGGLLAFIGYLVGFGIKAGLFPLHVWLPDAHPVAPSPASALLSGLMIKTGAFGLIRVFYQVFGAQYLRESGWNMILLYLAVVTIFIGSAVAILQDDLKRRLAYSSVGQIGYILAGIAIMDFHGLEGALFHVLGHALMKGSLFMAAGTIIHLTGKRKIEDLSGLGKEMPYTFGAFSIAALSMVGIPPLVGFISKWHLAWGALDARMPWIVIVLLVSSFMNGIYYLPIVISAFFKEKREGVVFEDRETPGFYVPVLILAFGIFFVGLLFGNLPLTLAKEAAGSVLLP